MKTEYGVRRLYLINCFGQGFDSPHLHQATYRLAKGRRCKLRKCRVGICEVYPDLKFISNDDYEPRYWSAICAVGI